MSAGQRLLHYLSILRSQLLVPDLVSHFVDSTGKPEWQLVAIVHWRAGIHPDVEGFIERHQEWNCMFRFLARHNLTVDGEHTGTAFTETWTIVFKVEHDGVLTR